MYRALNPIMALPPLLKFILLLPLAKFLLRALLLEAPLPSLNKLKFFIGLRFFKHLNYFQFLAIQL